MSMKYDQNQHILDLSLRIVYATKTMCKYKVRTKNKVKCSVIKKCIRINPTKRQYGAVNTFNTT